MKIPDAMNRVVHVPAGGSPVRGRALVSYLREPSTWSDRDRQLAGHSNKWEAREIVRILASLGHDVDVIDFRDHAFEPEQPYDVVLALDSELARLAERAQPRVALLHLTGAYGPFQNAAEQRRIDELEQRRGVRVPLERAVADLGGAERALVRADACSLIGNDWTLGTYPEAHRGKITPIPVSGSVPLRVRPPRKLVPKQREFLWFFGSGAVHKGLDRVLEAFAGMPGHTLHVVGNVAGETAFWDAYAIEAALPNVHVHGFLDPAGRTFRRATRGCFCVIAPSASEGTSPATVTMLQMGMLGIISRETGVTLPAGTGRLLERCTADEIAEAVGELAALPEDAAREQTLAIQADMLARHSRPAFSAAMRAYLERVT